MKAENFHSYHEVDAFNRIRYVMWIHPETTKLAQAFPSTSKLLRHWHINRNVIVQDKKKMSK
ncbi:hypothetical protein F444_04136 [Phytophthora nicotianae P1976]|uniref:Uncharacterized protein n=1 Tax=Phytophthora nicotianae P1976 TaxID=1317066 RepID=A0A081ARS3_PHYNI|nr:hypothetical protein F444_04136 [Phytophthora nicotianae P1976]